MSRTIEKGRRVADWRPEALLEEPLAELIYNLERAVTDQDPLSNALAVKDALEDAIHQHGSFIPERFLKPAQTGYARRLIYLGADRRFSLLAMVWDIGQGTPIHDHGGDWCVECVYRGRVKTTAYRPVRERDGVIRFAKTATTVDVEGKAQALVPPLEHHMLANTSNTPSVTLHVYAHELTNCNVYLPVDGGFARHARTLGYTP